MSWLKKLFGKEESSRDVAKQRLQMVLIHDRSEVSPGLLAEIKDDIIAVIAQRLAIDPDKVEVSLAQNARESRLVAEIPLTPNGRKPVNN